MLNIQDFTGGASVKTAEELVSFLDRRDTEAYNCFTLNHGDKEFPYLVIMVHEQAATATFVVNRDGRALQSLREHSSCPAVEVHLFKYSTIEAPQVRMAASCVIPFADAVTIAREYMQTRLCPTHIEWTDLG